MKLQAHAKIKQIEDLAKLLNSNRNGKNIVHCHGVFDLMHIGHIRHFEQAKELGDVLVVTVTPDQYVNRGPHRPVFSEDLRAEAIAALDCVDYVAINKWEMAVETIQLLRPDFYVKGNDYKEAIKDYKSNVSLEKNELKRVGGKLLFTDDITFSSSNLINRHMSVFPQKISEYLDGFRTRHPINNILSYLQNAQDLKVLVVGETIIDEYQYCQTLGKSGKEPILAAQYRNTEQFAGGVLAVANHAASFSDQVEVLTSLGTYDSYEEFIREKLNPKVKPIFLYMENAPTIVKRRFIEMYPFQKLFEIYVMDDGEGTTQRSQNLAAKLKEILPAYDIVIVTDYGHGMFSQEVIEVLCDQARFLAVNTQVNAGNHGFNTISKYPRADYISVSEKEIRLDARSERGDLRDIVLNVVEKLSCQQAMITRGEQGCLCYSQQNGFFEVPALAVKTVDRVGAGDAVFAVTSSCIAQQAPAEIVGFIGNAVGAQAVAMVGNKRAIERVPLMKHIESLLK